MLRLCLAGEYPVDVSKISGGVAYILCLLGETLAERKDIDLHIVTPAKGRRGTRVERKPGATIHYVGVPRRRMVPNMLRQVPALVSVFRELRPDVVNSHHCVTTNAAIRAGCTVVHTIHGVIHNELPYAKGLRKLSMRLHAALERKAISRSDAVLSVAQYGLDQYKQWVKSPGYVVPGPVEDLFFRIPPTSHCEGILYVGIIHRRKNLMALVRAMVDVRRKHHGAVLNVCGPVAQADYMSEIQLFVRRNGLEQNVNFVGLADRQSIPRYLADSVCLSLPSRQETAPVVISQAMAGGRAVVASPVGGVPEMVEDGVTGYLVEPDDIRTMAERISALMDNKDLVKDMGKAGRDKALESYERHAHVDQLLSICRNVLADTEKTQCAHDTSVVGGRIDEP